METQEVGIVPVKEKKRVRRVGSVTFGLILVLLGVLFFVHIVAPSLHYETIFNLWPIALVLLGVEILVENHRSRKEEYQFVYDFPAILMLFMVLLFAMMMAVIDSAMRYYQWWI